MSDDVRREGEQPTEEVGAVRVDPAARAAGSQAGGRPERSEGEARAAEVKRDVREADARREQEETARAEERLRKAQADRAREERESAAAREAADRARREAEEARRRADRIGGQDRMLPVTASDEPEPITFGPFPADRPELIVGAAFVVAFVVARILRRITE